MRFRDVLTATRHNLTAAARYHRGARRRELMRAAIAAQARLARRGGKPRAGRAGLLGYDVAYFSDEAFAILLSEVFINPHYYLDLRSTKPFIVDGGANIGMSVLLWKNLRPDCRVLAFEPDPETFALLERNVAANHLDGVRAVNRALGDAETTADFYYNPATPGNLGMSTIPHPALTGRRTVETTPLSPYLDATVDLLKLDVEGAEDAVIAELAASSKLGLVRQIVMEYHHHIHGDDRLGELLRTLEQHAFGYQLYSKPALPFRRDDFSPMFLYAYSRTIGGPENGR
jgi:FkbM family methyltransferase